MIPSTRGHLAACLLALSPVGCADAWAQPHRPRPSHSRDAGVRDAAVARPPTHGSVDPAAVQRVLRDPSADVRRCYESGLQTNPSAHGEVTVRLRVEPDGAVSDTSLDADPSLRRVGECIERVLRPVRFPRPTGGAATVTVPYVFTAGQ